MPEGRDSHGNYVNNQGVTIKVNSDSRGNDHVSFYQGPVDGDHSAAHVNLNYQNGTWSSQTHGEGHSNPSKGSGGCYLTTACMVHFKDKFDDNCYELRVLRWFRDNYVPKEDIAHYYQVAPIIVKAIDADPENLRIYDYIYDTVVDACVDAIEKGDYQFAYDRYKNSILAFEDTFAKKFVINEGVEVLENRVKSL